MIRDVNLLNSGKADRLVPKSEVLSAEATFSSFISLASTFSLVSNSAKSKVVCPRQQQSQRLKLSTTP